MNDPAIQQLIEDIELYRSDLAATRARIAALESRIKELESAPGPFAILDKIDADRRARQIKEGRRLPPETVFPYDHPHP